MNFPVHLFLHSALKASIFLVYCSCTFTKDQETNRLQQATSCGRQTGNADNGPSNSPSRSILFSEEKGQVSGVTFSNMSEVEKPVGKKQTPLHIACDYNQPGMVALLIEKGAKVDPKDVDGLTPLHLAVQKNFEHLISPLLGAGASPNEKDNQGRTPFHYACIDSKWMLIKKLLDKDADIHTLDNYGMSALHLAVQKNQIFTATVLIS